MQRTKTRYLLKEVKSTFHLAAAPALNNQAIERETRKLAAAAPTSRLIIVGFNSTARLLKKRGSFLLYGCFDSLAEKIHVVHAEN